MPHVEDPDFHPRPLKASGNVRQSYREDGLRKRFSVGGNQENAHVS